METWSYSLLSSNSLNNSNVDTFLVVNDERSASSSSSEFSYPLHAHRQDTSARLSARTRRCLLRSPMLLCVASSGASSACGGRNVRVEHGAARDESSGGPGRGVGRAAEMLQCQRGRSAHRGDCVCHASWYMVQRAVCEVLGAGARLRSEVRYGAMHSMQCTVSGVVRSG
jgi:hypothetical protein